MAAAACLSVSVGAFHLSMIDKSPHALRGCPKMWSACWLVDESPTRPQKYRCRARPPLYRSYLLVNQRIAESLKMDVKRGDSQH